DFYRVGGHQPIKASVRVIAATHQNLEARVRQGLFREDLFHRINVIRLRLPLLRERREDIPLLARHFLAKSARELGVEPNRLSDATVRYVTAQEFQGNVGQLENLCHWLTVMAPAATIEVKDLPPELRTETTVPTPQHWAAALEKEVESLLSRGETGVMDELTRRFEKALIVKALTHTGGRRLAGAPLLGLRRHTLTRQIPMAGHIAW